MLYKTIIFLSSLIIVKGLKIKVDMKYSRKCINAIGSDSMFIDSIGIFQTIWNYQHNYIIGAAMLVPNLPTDKDISIEKTYTKKDHLLAGPHINASDLNSTYHLVLAVRKTFLLEENPVYYFYRKYIIQWDKKTKIITTKGKDKDAFDKLYYEHPVLYGDIEVRINGRIVIKRGDSKDLCHDSYSWIPDHGIYHLVDGKFRTMYYYPHYYPHILS
ncbi:hypothetical protein V3C99_000445 [Haemonchus contortus]